MKHSVRRVGGMTEETVAYLNKVSQDHISMGLQHGERHKQYKLGAIVVRPEDFPQAKDILEWELALERYEDPSAKHRQSRHERHRSAWNIPETEEEVKSVRFLCSQSVSDRAAMSSETGEHTKMSI